MKFGIKLCVALLGAVAACGEASDNAEGNSNGDADGGASTGAGTDGDGGSTGPGTDGGGSNATTGGGDGGDVQPPKGEWKNVTANLAGMASECGNLTSLSAKPDEDMLIAGVAQKGMWATKDGGKTWAALGDGAGSYAITNRLTAVVYDPTDATKFWQSGLYNDSTVNYTSDNGKTFVKLGDLGSIDLVSIDFGDPQRKVLLAGGHETPRRLFRSDNGGMSWTEVGAGLPGDRACTYPLVINATTHLVGCYYGGDGIFRSTDSGATWNEVSKTGGIRAPLRHSDNSLYWAITDNKGLVRSTDDGVTWTMVTGPNTLVSSAPIELPDGRVAMLGNMTVVATADKGKTWVPVSAKLPYNDATGVVYSKQQKAFFISHFSCPGGGNVPVPADAVMRFDYDASKP